ncbi:MAG: glycosyltransferase family 4 protein [Syntrophomonadaceae bacterium]|nr:glycosyltransferase family 4 protein [Syntrophomonadaceae bacterium]
MRIGIFSDSYKPYVSGVVNSIETFTQELRSLGHEVYIFAPNYPNLQANPVEELGVFRFHSVPAPTNPDYSLAIPFSFKFGPTLKALNLDLIHVHTPFILGQVGAIQARRLNLPLVFTYHTLYEQYVHYVPINQNLTREVVVRYSRHFCNHCDLVIAPTGKVKDLLINYGVRKPIRVIPTGIDLNRFSQGNPQWLRQQYKIDLEDKILLFVGRLTKEKNVDFLIRSYAQIQSQFPQTVLVIVANGPEEDNLKSLTEHLALKDKVIFTGKLTGEELVNAYHGADMFVFPSVTETQGLVIVEAMAAGLPVVAIDANGVADMVSSGAEGILTQYTLEAFTHGVCELLGDEPKRKSMAKTAQQRAIELSSARMALRLEAAYHEVLQNRWGTARRITG